MILKVVLAACTWVSVSMSSLLLSSSFFSYAFTLLLKKEFDKNAISAKLLGHLKCSLRKCFVESLLKYFQCLMYSWFHGLSPSSTAKHPLTSASARLPLNRHGHHFDSDRAQGVARLSSRALRFPQPYFLLDTRQHLTRRFISDNLDARLSCDTLNQPILYLPIALLQIAARPPILLGQSPGAARQYRSQTLLVPVDQLPQSWCPG